jgi:hypothetical protein
VPRPHLSLTPQHRTRMKAGEHGHWPQRMQKYHAGMEARVLGSHVTQASAHMMCDNAPLFCPYCCGSHGAGHVTRSPVQVWAQHSTFAQKQARAVHDRLVCSGILKSSTEVTPGVGII